MFCFHKYEILESFSFEEKITDMMANVRHINITSEMFTVLSKRGIISVVKCTKCGKVKHIKTIL